MEEMSEVQEVWEKRGFIHRLKRARSRGES